jgi:hypothetical protein
MALLGIFVKRKNLLQYEYKNETQNSKIHSNIFDFRLQLFFLAVSPLGDWRDRIEGMDCSADFIFKFLFNSLFRHYPFSPRQDIENYSRAFSFFQFFLFFLFLAYRRIYSGDSFSFDSAKKYKRRSRPQYQS